MGYRSQVAFVVKFKSTQDRDAMWMLYANSDDAQKQEVAQELEHRYAEPIITYQHDDIKWYEGYEEVTNFERFWDSFRDLADAEMNGDEPQGDEPVHWACEFIRLGENTDDIEERSSSDAEWLLQVSRVIEDNY